MSEQHFLMNAMSFPWAPAVTAIVAGAAALAVALGAAIVAGLGAQGLVRDVIRGFALRFEGQLRAGDVVEIAGRAGTVEHVSLRYVRLRGEDGAVHFVRTGDVQTVTNRSYGRSYAVLDVPIASRDDLDRAIGCMRDAVAELRSQPWNALRVLDDLEIAGLDRWDDRGLQIRARISVAPGQDASVRRELLATVRRRLSTLTVV